ncbi:MAG: flagellar biosynthetic protein FliP, partial [Pseudomonadota bacterium]
MRVLPWLVLIAAALIPSVSAAQDVTLSLGEGGSISARSIQLILLITVLSLAPGLAIMITCFPFLITVLAILRQGIGLQQSPPNMLIVSLALFLTYFIIEPVFSEAWQAGIQPMINETMQVEPALERALEPFREFMAARLDADTFFSMAALRPSGDAIELSARAPLSVLMPSFMLSEIARAFQIGFLIFLPFLII